MSKKKKKNPLGADWIVKSGYYITEWRAMVDCEGLKTKERFTLTVIYSNKAILFHCSLCVYLISLLNSLLNFFTK